MTKTVEKFRGLSMLTLWYALFYFISLSIGVVIPLISSPYPVSLIEIVVSPYLFLVALGIASVLFPLYNTHRTLVKLKRQRLSEIRDRSQRLLKELDETLTKEYEEKSSDRTIAIMAALFSLQLRERDINEADEWPINIDFVSTLLGLVSLPTIFRVLVEFIKGYLAS